MRIGLVTGEYPPMEGGVGAFTEQLARGIHDLGHEVHIITSRKARPPGGSRSLSAVREPYAIPNGYLHPRTGRWRWPTIETVADIILRQEIDVVNIQYQAAAYNMSSPAINFLPWRIKQLATTIVTFHDLRTPYLLPKAGRLRELAVQYMARQAHGCITTNSEDGQLLNSWNCSPVAEIPIGSNISVSPVNHIEIREIRQKLGLADDDILLGYFGFINETKGADLLVEALSELDDHYHLMFIGGQTGASDDVNNQAFLEKVTCLIKVNGLEGRVHWTGYLRDDRVSAHLVTADIMVLPYRDGVSLRRGTLMAALAHGRPLVTTHPSHPIAQLIHGRDVWLVPAGDKSALAGAIGEVSEDENLRQRLGEGAFQVAQAFTWDKVAQETISFYESLPGEAQDIARST